MDEESILKDIFGSFIVEMSAQTHVYQTGNLSSRCAYLRHNFILHALMDNVKIPGTDRDRFDMLEEMQTVSLRKKQNRFLLEAGHSAAAVQSIANMDLLDRLEKKVIDLKVRARPEIFHPSEIASYIVVCEEGVYYYGVDNKLPDIVEKSCTSELIRLNNALADRDIHLDSIEQRPITAYLSDFYKQSQFDFKHAEDLDEKDRVSAELGEPLPSDRFNRLISRYPYMKLVWYSDEDFKYSEFLEKYNQACNDKSSEMGYKREDSPHFFRTTEEMPYRPFLVSTGLRWLDFDKMLDRDLIVHFFNKVTGFMGIGNDFAPWFEFIKLLQHEKCNLKETFQRIERVDIIPWELPDGTMETVDNKIIREALGIWKKDEQVADVEKAGSTSYKMEPRLGAPKYLYAPWITQEVVELGQETDRAYQGELMRAETVPIHPGDKYASDMADVLLTACAKSKAGQIASLWKNTLRRCLPGVTDSNKEDQQIGKRLHIVPLLANPDIEDTVECCGFLIRGPQHSRQLSDKIPVLVMQFIDDSKDVTEEYRKWSRGHITVRGVTGEELTITVLMKRSSIDRLSLVHKPYLASGLPIIGDVFSRIVELASTGTGELKMPDGFDLTSASSSTTLRLKTEDLARNLWSEAVLNGIHSTSSLEGTLPLCRIVTCFMEAVRRDIYFFQYEKSLIEKMYTAVGEDAMSLYHFFWLVQNLKEIRLEQESLGDKACKLWREIRRLADLGV